MKGTKKVVLLIMVLTMLLNAFLPILNSVKAVKSLDVEKVDQKGSEFRIITKLSATKAKNKYGGYPIEAYIDGRGWLALTCDMVGYYGEDSGKFYPAYCMDVSKPGAEDYKSGYDVVSKAWKDDELYSAVLYGYGYKTYKQLGVENNYDAFVATKMAVYSILYDWDKSPDSLNKHVRSNGTDRSDKIIKAIKSIVNKARKKTKSYKEPTAKITKVGNLVEKTIDDKEYIVQNYKLETSDTFNCYDLRVSGLPSSTKIYNSDFSNTIENNSLTNEKNFYVAILKKDVVNDVEGLVRPMNVEVKSYPVFYGTTKKKGTQDYILASDPYTAVSTSSELNIDIPDIDIYKRDRDSKTPLAGAEYDIVDKSTNSVVKHVGPTNSEGKITVEDLPVGDYKLVETVAPEGYNLDSDSPEFSIKINGDNVTINTDDSVITSTVEVTKLATDDNEITGDKAGTPLKGAKFNIYDINHKLLRENLETDETGKLDVVLSYGKYIVEEVRPPEFYLLADTQEANSQIVEVRKPGELIPITFENNSVKVGLVIEKEGIVQCQPNDEIRYDFPTLRNDSNVPLDDFTWRDVLPTKYIRATKLYTGTYNEDINYEVYYKTNKSGDKYIKLFNPKTSDGKFNTMTNNYINFAKLNTDEEYVTEWKLEFGTVKAGFEAVEKPFMFAKVNDTVKANDKWTNHTFLTGNYTSVNGTTIPLGSKDDWTTTSYIYKLKIKKLPQTGM